MCARVENKPESGSLRRLVSQHLKAFTDTDEGKPEFIRRTFWEFLDCGNFEKGAVRLWCEACKVEHLVAFRCKLRGICPYCSEQAANEVCRLLLRKVLPERPYRHLVVNYPLEVTQKLAFQSALVSSVERVVNRVLRRWMEARCGGASTGGVHFPAPVRLGHAADAPRPHPSA